MYTHSQSASVIQWGSHIVASATRGRADVSALVRSCCVQVLVTALRRHVRDDATLHGVSAVLSAGLKHCDDGSFAAHACASGVSAALLALVTERATAAPAVSSTPAETSTEPVLPALLRVAAALASSHDSARRDLLDQGAIRAVAAAMQWHAEDGGVVLAACDVIAALACGCRRWQSDVAAAGGMTAVLTALWHCPCPAARAAACSALWRLCDGHDDNLAVLTPLTATVAVALARCASHAGSSADRLLGVCGLLHELLCTGSDGDGDTVAALVVQHGGLAALVTAAREVGDVDRVDAVVAALTVLWRLVASPMAAAVASAGMVHDALAAGALYLALGALERHDACVNVVEPACGLLRALAFAAPQCHDAVALCGGALVLRRLLDVHCLHRGVVLQLCAAMHNLAASDGMQAALNDVDTAGAVLRHVIAVEGSADGSAAAGGAGVVVKPDRAESVAVVRSGHLLDAQVQQQACGLLGNLLCHRTDVQSSVGDAGGVDALLHVLAAHATDVDVATSALHALRELVRRHRHNSHRLWCIGGMAAVTAAQQLCAKSRPVCSSADIADADADTDSGKAAVATTVADADADADADKAAVATTEESSDGDAVVDGDWGPDSLPASCDALHVVVGLDGDESSGCESDDWAGVD
jgi:hypothetical protein